MNHTLQTGNKTGRIHLLDELRGFALLCMIFYHAFYTMFMLFHMEIGAQLIRFFMPAEPFFAGVFVLISGISSHLSKNNWSRGGKLLAVSMLITAVTMGYDYFFSRRDYYYFRHPPYACVIYPDLSGSAQTFE